MSNDEADKTQKRRLPEFISGNAAHELSIAETQKLEEPQARKSPQIVEATETGVVDTRELGLVPVTRKRTKTANLGAVREYHRRRLFRLRVMRGASGFILALMFSLAAFFVYFAPKHGAPARVAKVTELIDFRL